MNILANKEDNNKPSRPIVENSVKASENFSKRNALTKPTHLVEIARLSPNPPPPPKKDD